MNNLAFAFTLPDPVSGIFPQRLGIRISQAPHFDLLWYVLPELGTITILPYFAVKNSLVVQFGSAVPEQGSRGISLLEHFLFCVTICHTESNSFDGAL